MSKCHLVEDLNLYLFWELELKRATPPAADRRVLPESETRMYTHVECCSVTKDDSKSFHTVNLFENNTVVCYENA